jgi:ABC-2 type transport system permease protein
VSKDLTKSKWIGGAFGYLIMIIIIYGNMVMRSVIEEKTSRIVEIIISVKPIDDGKIIGTSLAGLLQILIWAIIGMLLLQLRHFSKCGSYRVSPEMMQTAQQEMTELPKCILRNYGIYSILIDLTLLAAIFYTVPFARPQIIKPIQQFLLPIIMPLMLSVGFTVINDPHGQLQSFSP